MAREHLLRVTRRELENLKSNRIDLAADVLEVPTAAYCDEGRHREEVNKIFKRVPLVLGFSCEFAEPGAYKAMTVCNVPVIVVRGQDGAMRSFVNMCSHRGNYVVAEGRGVTKRFRCEYHAWTYGTSGELISVFDESNFGAIDKSCNGLTALPTAERAGMVWVTLNPNSKLDIETFLAGYGEALEDLRFKDAYLAGQQFLKGPNWKVAYDGYRDYYHLPILHRNSFGPDRAHQPDYYAWGPHVRMTAPKAYEIFSNRSEDSITNDEMVLGVWTIFPNVSVAGNPLTGGYMVSTMFPGNTVTESFTIQNFMRFNPADDPSEKDALAKTMSLMQHVVANEDYATGLNVQRALATGAKKASIFGRNEGGGQMFHRWVDKLLATPDDRLAETLRNGL